MHGFCISLATTIAEPSTILPLIVHHFSSSHILVGLFASLLRGGAVVVQMFAAFYSQSLPRVMPYQRIVYLVRFLSWFGIGLALYIFGDDWPVASLWALGIGLFLFSFSAGFGSIYYREILGKIFSHRFLGKTMAQRQFLAAFGAVLSGAVAGWVLQHFEPPASYAWLFMVSSGFLVVAYLVFLTVDEPVKRNVAAREDSFGLFLRHCAEILRDDRALRQQIVVITLSYSYLLAMPFIILQANQTIALSGWLIGGYVSVQMMGAMAGNVVWGQLASRGRNRAVVTLSFSVMIAAFLLVWKSQSALSYGFVFFLLGAGMDGMRLVANNLIIIIAPEAKRPVYIALQFNITSLGLFFAIPGGLILSNFGYDVLYLCTLGALLTGLLCARRLQDHR